MELGGRSTKVPMPDGTSAGWLYVGLVTTATNPAGHRQVTTRNQIGQVIRVADGINAITKYTYDADGQLAETLAPDGKKTTVHYDEHRRRVGITTPETGRTDYVLDSAGRLKSSMDANGQVVSFEYDALDRTILHTDADGRTETEYDTALLGPPAQPNPKYGKGLVASVKRFHSGGTTPWYSESPTYDTLSRPASATRDISGTIETVKTEYDSLGRAETMEYPSGLKVKTGFNSQGFAYQLRGVRDATGDPEILAGGTPDGKLLWQALVVDAEGRTTKHKTGNNVESTAAFNDLTGSLTRLRAALPSGTTPVIDEQYSYDALHQLKSRNDHFGHAKSFTYDKAGRLLTVTGPSPKTFTYAVNGDIKTQSDYGTYTYNARGTANRLIPHAVSAVKAGTALVASFTYDNLGQMLTATRVAGGVSTVQNFAYTPSGHLETISTAGMGSIAFTYGPGGGKLVQHEDTNLRFRTVTYGAGHERIKQYDVLADPLTATPTETLDRYYLSAGGAVVAVFTRTQQHVTSGTAPPPTKSLVYMHHDRLGSVAAVTDSTGAVIERFSYEAFGKKRDATTWAPLSPGQGVAVNTTEGFTGHEQLEAFGLIHMGGRIYDPTLCRFTSADPFVQAPTNGQSFNRYSYIMNNPVNGTDPSGYSWFSDIWDAKVDFFSSAHDSTVEFFKDLHDDKKQFIKENYKLIITIAVLVVIAIVAPMITSALTGVATTAFTTTEFIIAGAIGGALSGAATTAIAGGSTSDILKAAAFGAVSGALTAYIGHGIPAFADGAGKYLAKPIVHGLVQGGISEAQGGDFKSAAIGGAAGSFLGGAMEYFEVGVGDKSFGGVVVRTAAAAAVGGTASKLGGGSFANGAVTAAFVHLFNHELINGNWSKFEQRAKGFKVGAAWQGYNQVLSGQSGGGAGRYNDLDWASYNAGQVLAYQDKGILSNSAAAEMLTAHASAFSQAQSRAGCDRCVM